MRRGSHRIIIGFLLFLAISANAAFGIGTAPGDVIRDILSGKYSRIEQFDDGTEILPELTSPGTDIFANLTHQNSDHKVSFEVLLNPLHAACLVGHEALIKEIIAIWTKTYKNDAQLEKILSANAILIYRKHLPNGDVKEKRYNHFNALEFALTFNRDGEDNAYKERQGKQSPRARMLKKLIKGGVTLGKIPDHPFCFELKPIFDTSKPNRVSAWTNNRENKFYGVTPAILAIAIGDLLAFKVIQNHFPHLISAPFESRYVDDFNQVWAVRPSHVASMYGPSQILEQMAINYPSKTWPFASDANSQINLFPDEQISVFYFRDEFDWTLENVNFNALKYLLARRHIYQKSANIPKKLTFNQNQAISQLKTQGRLLAAKSLIEEWGMNPEEEGFATPSPNFSQIRRNLRNILQANPDKARDLWEFLFVKTGEKLEGMQAYLEEELKEEYKKKERDQEKIFYANLILHKIVNSLDLLATLAPGQGIDDLNFTQLEIYFSKLHGLVTAHHPEFEINNFYLWWLYSKNETEKADQIAARYDIEKNYKYKALRHLFTGYNNKPSNTAARALLNWIEKKKSEGIAKESIWLAFTCIWALEKAEEDYPERRNIARSYPDIGEALIRYIDRQAFPDRISYLQITPDCDPIKLNKIITLLTKKITKDDPWITLQEQQEIGAEYFDSQSEVFRIVSEKVSTYSDCDFTMEFLHSLIFSSPKLGNYEAASTCTKSKDDTQLITRSPNIGRTAAAILRLEQLKKPLQGIAEITHALNSQLYKNI